MHARIAARRREVAAARRRRRQRTALSLAVLVALIAGAVGVARSPLLAVEEVRVVGVDAEQADQIRSRAGVSAGTNLLDVDLRRVARIVESTGWVRAAVVDRVPPSTIEIRVTPRRAVAVVDAAGVRWTVDRDGVVLHVAEPEEDADLTRIAVPAADLPVPGNAVEDPAVQNALRAHTALPRDVRDWVTAYDAASVAGLRMHISVPSSNGPWQAWVRLGAADRVADKAVALRAVLGDLSARGALTEVGEIDVRAAANPVVVPA